MPPLSPSAPSDTTTDECPVLTPFLAFLGLAAAPAIPLPNTSPGAIDHARSLWLLGCLALVTGWLAFELTWLAPIALWFLCFWRSGDDPLEGKPVSALVCWAGVGVTWWACRRLPWNILQLLPWVWIGLAWAQAGLQVVQYRRGRNRFTDHANGWLGQRTLTAGLYVLTIPFCPWWALPGPLVGLWLTGPSWGAVLALLPAAYILVPTPWLWRIGLPLLMVLPFLLVWSVRGQALIHWTPRGGSLDGVYVRWFMIRLCWHEVWREWRWLRGASPGTMLTTIRQWQARTGRDAHVAMSDLHFEALQVFYEYGVLGVLAMGCLAYEVGRRMAWGDPWTAAAVAGVGFACTTYSLRIAPLGVLWLAVAAGVGR